jgi:G3E family GTPase
MVIHGVQHIFHPPRILDRWPSEDHRTRIVFITRDIAKEEIDNTLSVFERQRRKR